jgi:predicted Zn-dependent protease
MMRYIPPRFLSVLGLGLVLFLWACATTPVTQRSQFVVISEQQEIQMGEQAAREILAKEPVSRNPEMNRVVDKVGRDIAAVADKPEYNWEFHVIAKDVVNAFALPGGKVFVYEGLYRLAGSQDQLATVIAHEVAHAVARHGAERLSRAYAVQVGGQITQALLGTGEGALNQLVMTAYGVGANVGIMLPHSRKQEFEADHIGLILQAKAGYSPDAAVAFWKKMAAKNNGQEPPPFLSTHPTDEKRIQSIRSLLPEARQYYRR